MLVGRSHECDYPPEIKDRPILTGAKNPFVSCEQMNAAVTATLQTGEGLYYIDQQLLKQLRPDVIVTQSLCTVCSVDLRLVEVREGGGFCGCTAAGGLVMTTTHCGTSAIVVCAQHACLPAILCTRHTPLLTNTTQTRCLRLCMYAGGGQGDGGCTRHPGCRPCSCAKNHIAEPVHDRGVLVACLVGRVVWCCQRSALLSALSTWHSSGSNGSRVGQSCKQWPQQRQHNCTLRQQRYWISEA